MGKIETRFTDILILENGNIRIVWRKPTEDEQKEDGLLHIIATDRTLLDNSDILEDLEELPVWVSELGKVGLTQADIDLLYYAGFVDIVPKKEVKDFDYPVLRQSHWIATTQKYEVLKNMEKASEVLYSILGGLVFEGEPIFFSNGIAVQMKNSIFKDKNLMKFTADVFTNIIVKYSVVLNVVFYDWKYYAYFLIKGEQQTTYNNGIIEYNRF